MLFSHVPSTRLCSEGTVTYLVGSFTAFWALEAALVRSHINGLIPFERTIEQTAEMPVAVKQ